MLHHYLDTSNTSGDHYAVSRSGMVAKVLAQLQSEGEQVRVALTPAQARHFARLLLAKADEVDGSATASAD